MERGGKRKREGSKLVPALCRVYFDLREWHAIKLITFGGGREGSKEEVEEERRRRKRVIQIKAEAIPLSHLPAPPTPIPRSPALFRHRLSINFSLSLSNRGRVPVTASVAPCRQLRRTWTI